MKYFYNIIKDSNREVLENLQNCRFLHRPLSAFEQRYSEILSFAMQNIANESDFYLKRWSEVFIDNFVLENCVKPSDIIVFARHMPKALVLDFINAVIRNNHVSQPFIIGIYASDVICQQLPIGEWIEIAGRAYVKYKMDTTISPLGVQDLFPSSVAVSGMFKEFILSWAYEESRLSVSAEKYFENNFEKKYEHLKRIKNNTLSKSNWTN